MEITVGHAYTVIVRELQPQYAPYLDVLRDAISTEKQEAERLHERLANARQIIQAWGETALHFAGQKASITADLQKDLDTIDQALAGAEGGV